MRRTTKSRVLRVVGLAGALLLSGWGVDASAASTDAAGAPAAADAAGGATAVTQARTTTVRFGPYSIEPAPPNPDGTHGHAHSGNQFELNVQKPCTNCYITSMTPDLVKADGTRAGFSNNLQLHHMVLFNRESGRTDATCPSSLGLFGQRFFASGDERTVIDFPEGYGYRVGSNATFNLIWDLASMSTVRETVYYTVTYEWVPASTPGMRDIEPVWLDVDQCGDSNIDIPAGPSSHDYTWTVNRPGALITIGGHLHDHGVNLAIRNDSTGELICDSVAGYGESPLYVDHHGHEHISSMSECGGPGEGPVTTWRSGQRVSITANYDAPEPSSDAMGISVAYVSPDGGGGGPGNPGDTCVTATNEQHVAAGRAERSFLFVYAVGSRDFLGLASATTSLEQAIPGIWSRTMRC